MNEVINVCFISACNGDPPAPSDDLEENDAVAGTQYHTESTITYNCITDTSISATIMCPNQVWDTVPDLLCRMLNFLYHFA